MSIVIKKQLVSDTPYRFKGVNKKKYITVHETDNWNRGAGAQNHADLQSRGNPRAAAWHYQVDDKDVIQSFKHQYQLWQSGDGTKDKYPNTKKIENGNLHSISIEICVNVDSDFSKAVDNAAQLTAKIMKDENIPLENVVQHNYWSGKNCPRNLRRGKDGMNWTKFISLVEKYFNQLVKKETGTSSVQQYKVVKTLNGFRTAVDAKNNKNKASTVKAGTYYIFNRSGGMLNVSSKNGVPGSWINPNLNKIEDKKKTVINNERFYVKTDLGGFRTAVDAKNNKNRVTTVKKGTYFIFNKSDGMYNITKKQGVPGSWINPNFNKESKIHVVKSGEILSHIALEYNTTVSKLVKDNNIKNKNKIYEGQKLVIR